MTRSLNIKTIRATSEMPAQLTALASVKKFWGVVLQKCQQCAVSKNFNGQHLSYWLKKLTKRSWGPFNNYVTLGGGSFFRFFVTQRDGK